MSDEGERTCPLCAEEMDLTDQQLKPCKCGYEICVWCWHHIMDMAEKDDTEGRCPACRSPYDKEKIVGMAANCERLVNEIHMEKKMKNQKAKTKSSDGRKQLSSVRVIQRNLVYIVGLPLNLADEELLQRREYFGQYGKVLKVSMSRTAAGVIQQFPNETCSVYITYSKEEEAIRCIQNVHGFVLEGRPLRACFGTTKYCHAWLRNAPCSNPDCLYLHEVGSQEDSFTKDEIISAYTRSRVQQITGATNNMQRRSGSILPPPFDDGMNNSLAKPIVKNASSNSVCTVRGSPPNGFCGRPGALPSSSSWGTQTTNCQPSAGGQSCQNGPAKAKPDTVGSSLPFSAAVVGTVQASALHCDVTKRPPSGDGSHGMPRVKNGLLKPIKQYNSVDIVASTGDKTLASDISPVPTKLNSQLSSLTSQDSDRGSCTTLNTVNSTYITGQSCSSGPEEAVTATNEEIQNLSCELSSIDIDGDAAKENSSITKPSSPPSDFLIKSPEIQGTQHNVDKFRDLITSNEAGKGASSDNGVCSSREHLDWRLDSHSQLVSDSVEDDVASFDNQRLKDPEVVCRSYLPKSTSFLHVSSHSSPHLQQLGESCTGANAGSVSANERDGNEYLSNSSVYSGYPEKLVSSSSYGFLDERNRQSIGRLVSEAVNTGRDCAIDKGESSIISNILSMDLDPWDDSMTSPHNLAKLLGDNTENQSGSMKKSSSWKVQSNNQSRFSFARQEESKFQSHDVHPSYGVSQPQLKTSSVIHDFVEGDYYMDKLGIANGFSTSNFEDAENISSGHFLHSNNKLSAVSRAQLNYFDNNEARLQLLMQRSLSQPQQNLRFPDIGNTFSQLGDSYGISSRLDQSQVSNISPYPQMSLQQSTNAVMSNGQWDGWNEMQSGNNLGVAELLRNERFGFNKFYSGYDDSKYRMPNSGDLYNRTFGM
ncbi:hypothetical protein AHAS_Ahas03G0015600 [Arachis hypogaea]